MFSHERFQALDSSFHMMFDFVQHSLKAVSDCQRDMSIVSICQRPGAPMRFLMQSEVKLKPPGNAVPYFQQQSVATGLVH
jgi:hypothetical protein